MDPLTLILTAAPSIFKGISGISQLIGSKKYSDVNRPSYNIPEGILESVTKGREMAGRSELPGQKLIEEKLGSKVSQSVSRLKDTARSTSDLLAGTTELGLKEMDIAKDLGIEAANLKTQNERYLTGLLDKLSQYQEKEWTMNKLQPYMESMSTARGLHGAGQQNLFSGLSNIFGVGAEASKYFNMNNKNIPPSIDNLFGNGMDATNTISPTDAGDSGVNVDTDKLLNYILKG